jgi:hypothetical protein
MCITGSFGSSSPLVAASPETMATWSPARDEHGEEPHGLSRLRHHRSIGGDLAFDRGREQNLGAAAWAGEGVATARVATQAKRKRSRTHLGMMQRPQAGRHHGFPSRKNLSASFRTSSRPKARPVRMDLAPMHTRPTANTTHENP